MTLPKQYLLSDFLKHRVRCDQGIDHGPGFLCWMHPPVHRLLGWSTKPSNLQLKIHVWRLDQLRGIGDQEAYVKGRPSIVEQLTFDHLPTLLNSDILNINGEKIGNLVDFVFCFRTGKIDYYLISRSDPRIPGTSRWRLSLDRISDKQSGMLSVNIVSLDELPLARTSIKEDFLKRSRYWREQIQDFSDQAGSRLEGWLEESPWEEITKKRTISKQSSNSIENDDWVDELYQEPLKDHLDSSEQLRYSRRPTIISEEEDDPWI